MKKLSALMLLSATMILASCGGKPAESKPEESKPAETSQTQTESKPASTVESKPVSTPASSSKPASTPASSSKPASTPASSSKPTSTPASTPASSTPAATVSVTLSAASLVTENNVGYIKLAGTSTGLTAANGKFALGLRHKDAASSGLADSHDGEWLVGGETPAAADFKHAPTISADGSFEVKISLAGITFVKGAYEIFVGPQASYAKLDLEQTQYGGGTIKTNGLGIILRSDIDLLFAEELPPVVLTEATTLIEGEGDAAKVILKVGGELGGATAAEFQAMTVKVTCERQVGGWKKNEMAAEKVTNVVEGTKGYIKIDVTALEVGGYQVKLGFDGTSAPDTKMECESYDKRNEATVLGNKEYAPYFQAGGNNADTLYGCCGLYIDNAATAITAATTRLEAETLPASNVTIATKEEEDAVTSGAGYAKEMTKTSGWGGKTSQLDAVIKLPAAGNYMVKVAYKSANATEAGAFELTVDGQSKGNKGAAAAEWTVFESDLFTLAAGRHTISIKGISNVKTDVDYVELVKHDHVVVAGDKAEASALRAISCECGSLTGYEMYAVDLTTGQKNPAESGGGNTEKNTRLGKNSIFDDVWSIAGITAGTYELYLKARCSSGNANAGYWNSGTAQDKGDTASNNGNSRDYKYKVKVDEGEYAPIGNDQDNYAATGLNENTPAWTTKAMATLTIAEGATTLTVHNMNNGYAIWVYGVRLVKVAA